MFTTGRRVCGEEHIIRGFKGTLPRLPYTVRGSRTAEKTERGGRSERRARGDAVAAQFLEPKARGHHASQNAHFTASARVMHRPAPRQSTSLHWDARRRASRSKPRPSHVCGLCQGHGVTKHGRVRVVKRPVRVQISNDDSGLHFLDSQLFVCCCACGLVCLARRLHMLDCICWIACNFCDTYTKQI